MDGLPVIEAPKLGEATSAIAVGGGRIAQLDTGSSRWIIDAKPGNIRSPVFSSDASEKKQSNLEDTVTRKDKVMPIAMKDTRPYAVAAAKQNIDQTAKSSESFEQRPKVVYVDSPARIERNINDADYILSGRRYQATPTISRSGPNRYWAAWRADNKTAGEGPGNFAVLAYSDDKNKSFKEYGYLTYSPEHPGNQIVDPMLWTDPDGRLWLFYGVLGNNQHYDGVGGSWAIVNDSPNAEDPVWSEPFRLSYHGVPRVPIKVGDRWYMAIDGWRFSAEEPPMYMDHVGPHIYELDWKKKRVKHVSRLPPNNNGQYSGFFETEFVERKDGAVAALLRWQGKNSQVLFSVSKDGMRSWTPWQDYKVIAPSSSSRVWLGRTPSGRLLLCWNNDTVRRTLTVGLSEDEGRSWKFKKIIEPDAAIQVSYPVVAFGDDSEIFVIYDSGRDSNRQIRVSKVIEQEIISGSSKPLVNVISDPARQ
ncbi:sialidase family protein [Pseudomonas sp. PARCl1]|uniref:sialidase family protein n=1 Tax=Pseudomonas sp. PARCl1 TaxID=2853444 RepID=UPI00248D4E5A|nr:sialidase family protein [Pseudomonas sp. PARCl1]